jgi:hypothetical protein
MQIVKSSFPLLVEIDDIDITLFHLALYEYKEHMKKTNKSKRKRKLYQDLNRLIALVDLMM